jgi:hypothetical protein
MPIPILFTYATVHTIQKQGGNPSYAPALTQMSRLYVIRNTQANNFPYYVGTADNVQNRFGPRLDAVRQFGFRNTDIGRVSIAVVQIFVNGIARPPHQTGVAGGIDVEHLLIRLYVSQGQNVRNIQKVLPFTNNHGQRLDCTFINPAAWVHFVPANTNINPLAQV